MYIHSREVQYLWNILKRQLLNHSPLNVYRKLCHSIVISLEGLMAHPVFISHTQRRILSLLPFYKFSDIPLSFLVRMLQGVLYSRNHLHWVRVDGCDSDLGNDAVLNILLWVVYSIFPLFYFYFFCIWFTLEM